MNIPDKKDDSASEPKIIRPVPATVPFADDIERFKRFFAFTGGSFLYCLSAAFVAYGIVNLMGPILSKGEAFKESLPCIFTLHFYELALLAVLILIVTRKVVDDAISVLVIIALFLVGTSIALGSVADTGITGGFWLGLAGIAIAFSKFCVMRRFAGIKLRILSILGLGLVMVCNYLGPVSLARSIALEPSQVSARREFWWIIWLVMLTGIGFVLIEAMKGKPNPEKQQDKKSAFLHSPSMVYVFALIIAAASGIHMYAMAYTTGLERVLGDYVAVTAMGALLFVEILRHIGKRFGVLEVLILAVPFGTVMLAISEKSVVSTGQTGFELLGYPPAILGLTGLVITAFALYRRQYLLLGVAAFYALGVILTFGFNPAHPHDLNVRACIGTLTVLLLVYGLIIKNPSVCFVGIVILSGGLTQFISVREFIESYRITLPGGAAGVCGLGTAAICLLFGNRVHKAIRIIGAICLAGAIFDYLANYSHGRYVLVLIVTAVLTAGLWFRLKDVLIILLLWMPSLVRLYILAKRLAQWRYVIVGFVLLAVGTVVSLFKDRITERLNPKKPESKTDD
ncbi:MAG: hypothetical protein ABII09_01350 [Planctomycetota bacterium]